MPRARRRYFPNPPACAHLVPDLGADQVRPRRFSGALLMPIGSLARRVIPASVRKGLRNFLSPRHARTWTLDPGRIPWFDRPDALELLESRRRREHLSDADTELLTRWTTDGYCVAAGIIPADLIDSMLLDLDNAWTAQQPFAGLDFCDLRFGPGDPVAKTSHHDLLQASAAERLYARSHSNWRTSSFHDHSVGASAIFRHQELKRLCSLILDRPAFPQGSINFEYGSAQEAHQDTAVFHVFPPNFIVGAWIACEDISPGCGALMFYPKSHRQPLFNKFDNYPQTNLRTAGLRLAGNIMNTSRDRPVNTSVNCFWQRRVTCFSGMA